MEDLILSRNSFKVKIIEFVNLSQFTISHPHNPHAEAIKCYPKVLKQAIKDKSYNTKYYQLKEGSIKIVADHHFNKVYRAKILKIYCPVKDAILKPAAEVYGLDSGTTWTAGIHQIFEFPPLIKHWSSTEPMMLNCCLFNLSNMNISDQLRLDHFVKSVHSANKPIEINIREFIEDKLHVDIIEPTSDYANGKKLNGRVKRNLRPERVLKSNIVDWQDSTISCFSYIQDIQQTMRRESGGSFPSLRQSLLGVEIMWWDGPDLIYVRPADPRYREACKKYQELIDSSISMRDDQDCISDRIYHVNDFCLMKNDINDSVGTWIRGKIELVMETQTNGEVRILQDRAVSKPFKAMSIYDQCINALSEPRIEGFVYKVRSIDYGFVCLRTQYNLRPLNEALKKVGSLSMRCSLFGLHPTGVSFNEYTSRVWSTAAMSFFHRWIYEMQRKKFYILIREDTKRQIYLSYSSVNPLHTEGIGINLFCWTASSDLTSLLKSSETEKFRSICTILINHGLATDYCEATKTSSRIFIDEELINTIESKEITPIDKYLSTDFRRALLNLGSVR